MSIGLTHVSKTFGGIAAVRNVVLDVPSGAFCCIVGPSGCGKSTLLRLIAGLERPDQGEISLGSSVVASDAVFMAPEDRGVGVVFQSYALWPHMSVQENVAFPFQATGMARAEALDRASEHLRTVSLGEYADRKPAALSGGQRQRVALARCLSGDARTILMDEPLANLDPHLRGAMEDELRAFHDRSGVTTVYITHDQREAMALADIMAVMDQGEIVQLGSPEELYQRPATEMVARFIGRGTLLSANVIDGHAHFLGHALPVETTRRGAATVLIRPEDVALGAEGWPVTVAAVTYRGGYWEARVESVGEGPSITLDLDRRVAVGDPLGLVFTGAWVVPG